MCVVSEVLDALIQYISADIFKFLLDILTFLNHQKKQFCIDLETPPIPMLHKYFQRCNSDLIENVSLGILKIIASYGNEIFSSSKIFFTIF